MASTRMTTRASGLRPSVQVARRLTNEASRSLNSIFRQLFLNMPRISKWVVSCRAKSIPISSLKVVPSTSCQRLRASSVPIALITFSISGSRQVATTRHFASLLPNIGQFPPKAVGALSRWETLFGRVRPTRVCLPFGPDFSLTEGGSQVTAAETQVYNNALVEAVKRFQASQGLDVDGVIGSTTIVAMNVPVQERINSIILAMERLRWMPEDLGQQYLIVNIAGFELRRINAGEVEERMAVVVGKPYHRTPVFSDRIRFLEFNPYWNVPPDIAIKEELPALRSNAASRAAQGFEAVRGDQVVDVRSVDWAGVGAGRFPYQLRQRPGTNNALGRVKFMFPNPHNVYLHDSPAHSLFGRSVRAFSHGCIRLSRPLELAEQVLRVGGVKGWTKERIDDVVASTKTTVVNLREPLPVHITYLTAWVDDGVANFRQDIYGHDAKLLAALEGKSIAW